MEERYRASPPPRYSEASPQISGRSNALGSHGNNPWLVGRTSIHVESSSAADTESTHQTSIAPSKTSEQRSQLRGFFRKDEHERSKVSTGVARENGDTNQLGTQVTIEAAMPLKSSAEKRVEMKGLEQAASAKRWAGDSRPGEAWGKLMKDPELWDSTGDTLVYFGYHRPEASFRIKSSLLEETKSEYLLSKLQEGFRKEAKQWRPTSQSPTSSSSMQAGMKSLSINGRPRRGESGHQMEFPVRYEIHFPAPHEASRLVILRHHLTTRNFFALLLDKSIVGLTFYQALVDLQERLEDIIPGSNSAQTIIRYLIKNHLHNVSNDPAAAAGLLAWSEDNFWQEGWREGYVHCCGMYSVLRAMPEFRDVTHVTRTLLERSNLELQVRVQEAEERLASFQYNDMWPARRDGQASVPTCFHSFRRFLIRYYEKSYKAWPPRIASDGGAGWLSRALVIHLQADFCALYNLLVNADTYWDADETHVVRRSDGSHVQPSDTDEMSIKHNIVAFDQKHKLHHIPHPYPLLPRSIAVGEAAIQSQNKSLFGSKSKTLEKSIVAASNEATNAILLGPDVTTNPLVEAFVKFDRSDRLGEDDPQVARKARWLMLYGVLQTLTLVANDSPQLWFSETTTYFLSAKLKGMPPWKTSENVLEDASRTEMYRWLLPKASS